MGVLFHIESQRVAEFEKRERKARNLPASKNKIECAGKLIVENFFVIAFLFLIYFLHVNKTRRSFVI